MAPKEKARARPASKPQVQAAGGPGVQADLRARFPLLGAGVVQAALQAGVPTSNLEQMQKLLSRGKPGAKVGDLETKVAPDVLSEDDG